MWRFLSGAMLSALPDRPGRTPTEIPRGTSMIYRHFVRDGQIAETRRQELLHEVARQQSIVAARRKDGDGMRPFAAPGSFLIFLKRHFAGGRFHPAARPSGVTG